MRKKITTLVMAGALAFSLASCGVNEENTVSDKTEPVDQISDEQVTGSEEDSVEYEDIYMVVDEINIDNSEISLKYTGYEIVDDTDNDGQPVRRIALYYDFTNKTSTAMSATSSFDVQAFQSGIQMQGWGGSQLNESLKNEMVDVIDGATINVGFLFDLNDENNSVKVRIRESLIYEGEEQFAQQQEISLQ